MARAIQPLGSKRKAKPMASAECGVASTGARAAPMRRSARLWMRPSSAKAQKATASTNESSVAAKPVNTVSVMLRAMPGCSNRLRHGDKLKSLPPMAGR